ncbi:MAG: polyketide synthase, partial [bacterium]|nr:polyketide synthase [bacterium]
SSLTTGSAGALILHPLLHQNTSDLSEQRFSSTFSGKEFFLNDHRVNGKKVLPGVCYLEMAGAAVEKANGRQEEGTSLQLKNVVWSRPITVNNHVKEVHIALFEETNGRIQYEVYTAPESEIEEPIVHSQGVAEFKENEEVFSLDIEELRSQMNQGVLSAETCYQAFKTLGLNYGSGHQAIQEIYQGENQILAKLILPSSIQNTLGEYLLHPSLMDAALQSSIGLSPASTLLPDSEKTTESGNTQVLKPSLPFALESLEILGSCSKEMLTWVRHSEGNTSQSKIQKLDIDLCDQQGNIRVKMRGFSSRVLDKESGSYKANETVGTLLTTPILKETPIPADIARQEYSDHRVILCEIEGITANELNSLVSGSLCVEWVSNEQSLESRFTEYAIRCFETIQEILKKKPQGNVLIQIVTPYSGDQSLFAGLLGLLKTASLENRKVVGQLIQIDGQENSESLVKKLKENQNTPYESAVKYAREKRFVSTFNESKDLKEKPEIVFRENGVYLITG